MIFSILNMKYKTTEEIFNKLQKLKGKTKLNFHQSITDYYNQRKLLVIEAK